MKRILGSMIRIIGKNCENTKIRKRIIHQGLQLDLGHYTAHDIHISQLRAFSKLWAPPAPMLPG